MSCSIWNLWHFSYETVMITRPFCGLLIHWPLSYIFRSAELICQSTQPAWPGLKVNYIPRPSHSTNLRGPDVPGPVVPQPQPHPTGDPVQEHLRLVPRYLCGKTPVWFFRLSFIGCKLIVLSNAKFVSNIADKTKLLLLWLWLRHFNCYCHCGQVF